jgi:diketogulonate reductase-like aldo/keto reductase
MNIVRLNNGTTIPAVGIGTFLMQPDDAQKAVTTALQSGYTLVDTANAYMNEKAVGRGMKASGLDRGKIYLSTKLWPSIYQDADRAIDETLSRLGTDYIDLLFLHQPVGNYRSAYQAMEKAVKAGKVRSLGLSNFSIGRIQEIAEAATILPAVVQVEAHPYFPETALKIYLQQLEAVMMAWYPLGHGDAVLANESVFTELAEKYHKSKAQIILRWHVQTGNIVIPGSKNPAHIKENIDIFDFALTDKEMTQIACLANNTRYYTVSKEALEGYLRFSPDFKGQQ